MDAQNATAGDVSVALSGADTRVTEKRLDVTDVGAAFKKMGGKGVAQAVNRNVLVNFCLLNCLVKNLLG